MPGFRHLLEMIGTVIEGVGVLVIVLGLAMATFRYLWPPEEMSRIASYRTYRQDLGRAILLGLEILVAGDIIRTVAAEPTLVSVTVLGGIVLIRTFLSMSLEVELEGRWPWQRAAADARGDRPPPPA